MSVNVENVSFFFLTRLFEFYQLSGQYSCCQLAHIFSYLHLQTHSPWPPQNPLTRIHLILGCPFSFILNNNKHDVRGGNTWPGLCWLLVLSWRSYDLKINNEPLTKSAITRFLSSSHTHTHTLSLSLSLYLPLSLSLLHTHFSHSHALSHTHTLSLLQTHTHTYFNVFFIFISYPPSLFTDFPRAIFLLSFYFDSFFLSFFLSVFSLPLLRSIYLSIYLSFYLSLCLSSLYSSSCYFFFIFFSFFFFYFLSTVWIIFFFLAFVLLFVIIYHFVFPNSVQIHLFINLFIFLSFFLFSSSQFSWSSFLLSFFHSFFLLNIVFLANVFVDLHFLFSPFLLHTVIFVYSMIVSQKSSRIKYTRKITLNSVMETNSKLRCLRGPNLARNNRLK